MILQHDGSVRLWHLPFITQAHTLLNMHRREDFAGKRLGKFHIQRPVAGNGLQGSEKHELAYVMQQPGEIGLTGERQVVTMPGKPPDTESAVPGMLPEPRK